jgi:hypothetical protein
MNRNGQAGIVTFLFMLFVFVLVWALFLGEFLSIWGAQAIAVNQLTGIEAFMMGNINLVIFICVVIVSAVGASVMSGGGQ